MSLSCRGYATSVFLRPPESATGASVLPISAELRLAFVGRYEIERLLGSGGMAEVYLATDLRHGRKVAVKVLRPEIAGAVGSERFVREIAIVAKLAHPNIVPLHDSGTVDGITYFVMPYVEGESLRRLITERGRLNSADAVRIALEVAEALHYAHERGIVHRDIKPENVLLATGHALVADFGIARAIEAASTGNASAGMTGSLAIGTPAYMSPEQADNSSTVDRRSDLYSLGLLVYEMLAGELPPRAVTPRGRFSGGFGSGARRWTRPHVPIATQRVIAKAIATRPADRFATATEFAAALRVASGRSAWKTIRTGALWIVGAIVAGLGYGLLQRGTRTGVADQVSPRRVVIAPLANRTGLESFENLGQIAADWVTGGLQRTGIVEIVPSETAFEAYRKVQKDTSAALTRDPVRALALETGAGMVVTGAYYLQDTLLLLRVQLSDAVRGRLLDAPEDVAISSVNPLAGIVELRNRLMGWFAVHYDERLEGHSRADEKPPTYASYLAFSEGMSQYLDTRNEAAVALFLRAYELDSTFWLALLYASIGLTNVGDYPRADSLLRLVEPVRDVLSPYHRAWLDYRRAFVSGNNVAALEAIRVGAELAPGSKAAYNHAVAAFQAGHVDEALNALTALSPDRGPMARFFPYWDLLGAIRHMKRDYRQELRAGREAAQRYPERMAALVPLVRALAALGRVTELDQVVLSAKRLPTDPIGYWSFGALLGEVGLELIAHGQRAKGVQMLEESIAWYREFDRSPSGDWAQAQMLYVLQQWQGAREITDRLIDRNPTNVEFLGLRGLLAAHEGDSSAAAAVADLLAADRQPYLLGAATVNRSRIEAVLGNLEKSVDLLRQSFAEGKEYDLWLHRDPDLLRLRGYAPFEQLVRPRATTR